jgi:hypothetical protein
MKYIKNASLSAGFIKQLNRPMATIIGRFLCYAQDFLRPLIQREAFAVRNCTIHTTPNGTRKCALKRFDKLEFAGMPPQAIRAWCRGFRYCPSPLGIVPAEQLDKLEFIELVLDNT